MPAANGHLTAAPLPANDDIETFGLQHVCHTASSEGGRSD